MRRAVAPDHRARSVQLHTLKQFDHAWSLLGFDGKQDDRARDGARAKLALVNDDFGKSLSVRSAHAEIQTLALEGREEFSRRRHGHGARYRRPGCARATENDACPASGSLVSLRLVALHTTEV